MLRELSVQNLALIEDVRVELQPGFCAWTGETGAGKSLLLGALGMLLGERGNVELLRAGAEELRVTGCFEINRPELRQEVEAILGHQLEDEMLIVARRLARSGRSVAYVNDEPVTIAKLRELGGVLVDIHGQRESYSLLQPAYQLQLLDAFGKLQPAQDAYIAVAERLREMRRRYSNLLEQQELRRRELTLLNFERDELDAAAVQPDELPELMRERERLRGAQELQEFAADAASQLYDREGSIVVELGRLAKAGEEWADLDAKLGEAIGRLDDLVSEVQDLAYTFRDLAERFEPDPERLEEIEKRLNLIRRLETKYRRSADQLADYRDEVDRKAQELQKQEDDLSGLEREIRAAYAELIEAAAVLSKGRAKVAKKLAAETQKHLADLGMPNARLDAVLEPVPLSDDSLTADVPLTGFDHLELMLTANKGEPARPLRKVASGGEMSRTMLALKSVLSAHDPVGTLVFDEIDSNVGGRLGDILGAKLAGLGRTHQVICVTHLPQVASYAAHQWTIRKSTKGTRTSTTITPLDGEQARIEELAHMLRGDSRGETTYQEVAKMMRDAAAVREQGLANGRRGSGDAPKRVRSRAGADSDGLPDGDEVPAIPG